MNSKTLVFVLFAAWTALCWRWYVCDIKQACGDEKKEAVADITPSAPAIEEDTSLADLYKPGETPSVQPAPRQSSRPPVEEKKAPATTAKSAPSAPRQTIAVNKYGVEAEETASKLVIRFPSNEIRKDDLIAVDDYLKRWAKKIKSSGNHVSITGHTDFVGEPEENLTLGLRRAQSVRDALLKKGAPKAQMHCYSKGDTKPVADNDTPQGRFKNRRVEIVVIKSK